MARLGNLTVGGKVVKVAGPRRMMTVRVARPTMNRKGRTKRSFKRVMRNGQGIMANMFPNVKYTKMEYANTSALSSGIVQDNFGGRTTYSLNSIWEPRPGATVFRPQGYSQISSIYGKYKVYGAKVHLEINNPSQDGLYFAMRVNQAGTDDTLTGEAVGTAEMKKWTYIYPVNNTGSQIVKKNYYFDIRKVEGLNKTQFIGDIDNYSASIAAAPTREPKIQVALLNSANANDANINFTIKIEYLVQLFEREFLPSSAV